MIFVVFQQTPEIGRNNELQILLRKIVSVYRLCKEVLVVTVM